ncbi:MAG: hypothetical protein NVS4B11_16220 [Ktedonobacteraceae bacterium]
MPRIGSVEKLRIANILQRIETFTKTGLLVIKQDTQWIEFYCRDGRLLCVGPIRTDATLGERLLQDGVISSQALQETMSTIGSAVPSETRIALTLMDLGYVKREELRNWVAKETEEILRVAVSWSTGEIYFEENAASPAERLLVSLSISTLLASLTPVNVTLQATGNPVAQSVSHNHALARGVSNTDTIDVSQSPTLFDSSQFFAASSPSSLSTPPASPTPHISANAGNNAFANTMTTGPIMPCTPSQTPPPMPNVPMTTLPPIRRIDTSFMHPEMVLVPGDLSATQEMHLQVTPEQWCLLTCVDGRTSLQSACTTLNMNPDQVCRVAGELLAERIIYVVPPYTDETQEVSPASYNLVHSGLNNGYAVPEYAATPQSLWGNVLPASDGLPQFSPTLETQSQWGNGGNGAKFVQGQGWIAPMQPLPPNGFGNSGMYASVGGGR